MDVVRPKSAITYYWLASGWVAPALLGILLLPMYFLSLAGNHTEAEDALVYAADVRRADPVSLSHPNHILYGWLGYGFYRLIDVVRPGSDPLFALQILDALSGTVGVVILFCLLRRLLGPYPAAAASLFLGLSYGYWWYSVESEVYVVSAATLIAAFGLAYRALSHPSTRSYFLLGAGHGLAVLAHVSNVLFAAVVLATLLLMRARVGPGISLKNFVAYALSIACVAGLPYAAAATLVARLSSVEELSEWLAYYIVVEKYGGLDLLTPVKASIGMARAMIGGHFVFAFPALGDVMTSVGDFYLFEERFLARGFDSTMAIGLLFATLLFCGVIVRLIAVGVRNWRMVSSMHSQLVVLLLAWLVPYAVFFAWYDPKNLEFWIAPMVPITILLSLPLATDASDRSSQSVPALVVAAVVLLGLINWFGSVRPQQSPDLDFWRQKGAWYESHARSGDLIVAGGGYVWASYLTYYTRARVFALDQHLRHAVGDRKGLFRQLDLLIQETFTGGGDVYFTVDAIGEDPEIDGFGHRWDGEDRMALREWLFTIKKCDACAATFSAKCSQRSVTFSLEGIRSADISPADSMRAGGTIRCRWHQTKGCASFDTATIRQTPGFAKKSWP
ncbi:MAG: glycosyltransferase family 39 protein [Chloroflexi bacterium]|nr:glycosyltransferase family 39 protein [Chloroflexota bacterium]